MADLLAMARSLGFERARTYIASGNLVFESASTEAKIKAALEAALAVYARKPVGVMVRTASELAAILAANPFPEKAPNRTLVIFLDHAPAADTLERVVAPDGEEVRLGKREIYVHYGEAMARSKLKIPTAKDGTARNINTVTRLVAMTK